jgi:hypothetical protein
MKIRKCSGTKKITMTRLHACSSKFRVADIRWQMKICTLPTGRRTAFRDIPLSEKRFRYLFEDMKSILLLSLVCIVAPPVAGSATAVLVQSRSPNCEGDFELTDYAFSCVGDECLFGSAVQLSGICKYALSPKVYLRLLLSLVMVCIVSSRDRIRGLSEHQRSKFVHLITNGHATL